MAGNPVEYAESTLGVHDVWKDGEGCYRNFTVATDKRVDLLKKLRSVRSHMTDREMELSSEVRGRTESISAWERELKQVVHDDGQMKGLRADEANLQYELDLVDADIAKAKEGMHLAGARMTELGGLLEFYAAAKRK